MKGGKREGAGRKPRKQPKRTITIRLDQDDFEKFETIRKSMKLSQSLMVKYWMQSNTEHIRASHNTNEKE